jgi:hypothetical protein
MIKKACIAAGLMLALGGLAFADTPIGPGVTGKGGTGRDAADMNTRAGAGGEARELRQDGTPTDRADAQVKGSAKTGSDRNAPQYGTGASTGAPATGTAGRATPSPDGHIE